MAQHDQLGPYWYGSAGDVHHSLHRLPQERLQHTKNRVIPSSRLAVTCTLSRSQVFKNHRQTSSIELYKKDAL